MWGGEGGCGGGGSAVSHELNTALIAIDSDCDTDRGGNACACGSSAGAACEAGPRCALRAVR